MCALCAQRPRSALVASASAPAFHFRGTHEILMLGNSWSREHASVCRGLMCSLPTFARPFTWSTTSSESRNTRNALDSATAGELESFDESPIFRNGVDGGSDPFGDLSNAVTVGVPEDDSDRTLSWSVGGPGAGTVCIQ